MQTKIATPGTVVHRVKNDRTVQDCATKLDKFQTTLAVEINKAYSRMIISTESSPKAANKFLPLSFQEVRHDHILPSCLYSVRFAVEAGIRRAVRTIDCGAAGQAA